MSIMGISPPQPCRGRWSCRTARSNCHSHSTQSFPATASGSFTAPDHEYPFYLELSLTATDSTGLQHRDT